MKQMNFLNQRQRTQRIVKRRMAGLLVMLGCFSILLSTSSKAGFDSVYTGTSKSVDKPSKVEFQYRLTPSEEIVAVKAKMGGEALFPQVVKYIDQDAIKTAVLFLIDTSNPRRGKEMVEAKKLVANVLSQADVARHTFGIYPFHGELDEQFAPMGTSLPELKQKVVGIKANGINTILYGSMLKAITALEQTEASRKAIVVISDWKSEDNVMNTKDFVSTSLERMKAGKIVCHSVVLVEEDQSELDTAEKLSSETGGKFVKVTRQSMTIPATFADGLLGDLENGGTAVVDMTDSKDAKKIVFEVETADGNQYEFVHSREAQSSSKASVIPAARPVVADVEDSDSAPKKSENDSEKLDLGDEDPTSEEAKDIFSNLIDGKDIYGLPIWAILAAIALIVFILIVILLIRGGKNKEDDFDSEFVKPGEGEPPVAEGIAGLEGDEQAASAYDAPPLPEVSAYPEQFDLGNGTAHCRTLPESGESIIAELQFGENSSRGVYPISEDKKAIRIGRGSDNDLSLNNDSVSRHHAEILSKRDGSFAITDLDSGNGVFVNNQGITQSALQAGDRVEIGEVTFVFHVES